MVDLSKAGVAAMAGRRRRKRGGKRLAIYTRYSMGDQHSTEDQRRTILEWAAKEGLIINEKLIFMDEGETGKLTKNRAGFLGLMAACVRDEFDVVAFFSTSRLYRKMRKALEFVEETIVEQGKRTVFVSQNIDTAKTENWKLILTILAMADEMYATQNVGSIRAAHVTKALRNERIGIRTFGYMDEEVEGPRNRHGHLAKRIRICPNESKYVKLIFEWFVHERAKYGQIARRLNIDPDAPKPAQGDHWSPRTVKTVLRCLRYIADWSYGWETNQYRSDLAGPTKLKLDEPQRVIIHECNRIIEDDLFHATAARMASMPGTGGRRAKDYDPEMPCHPLKGLFHCPKHGRLWYRGQYWCFRCQREAKDLGLERALFSGVTRDVALAAMCQRIGEAIEQYQPAVEAAAEAALKAAKIALSPDRGPLEKVLKRIDRVTQDIKQLMDNLGDTDMDRAESNDRLDKLRADRAKLNVERVELENAIRDPATMPTASDVRRCASGLKKLLADAATAAGKDYGVRRALGVLMNSLIDGPVMLSQQGDAKRNCGWLRATFKLSLGRLDPRRPVTSFAPIEVSVDLKSSDEREQEAAIIMLYDSSPLAMKKIAKKIGTSFEHVRKIVARHLSEKGMTIADSIRRPFMPRTVLNGTTKHIVRTPEVMEMFHGDRLLGEIVEMTGLEIHTVKLLIKIWHEERGLPVPDCRSRRKALKLKNRPKPPEKPPVAA